MNQANDDLHTLHTYVLDIIAHDLTETELRVLLLFLFGQHHPTLLASWLVIAETTAAHHLDSVRGKLVFKSVPELLELVHLIALLQLGEIHYRNLGLMG